MAEHLALPSPGRLPTTGPVDWIARYHSPVIGAVMRRRLAWALEVLPKRLDRVLEVGYGSGVFQYELSRRARLSVGIDPHDHAATVRTRLAEDGVPSLLLRGDGTTLPFQSATFDAVVAISALEFVGDPLACLRECRRVLRPGGRLVCIRPRELKWADSVLKFLTRHEAEDDFQGMRLRVEAAIDAALAGAARLRRPALLPGFLAPYELVVSTEPADH